MKTTEKLQDDIVTLSLLQKWLRETYDLDVYVTPFYHSDKDKTMYTWNIIGQNNEEIIDDDEEDNWEDKMNKLFCEDTYEKALKKGLDKMLESFYKKTYEEMLKKGLDEIEKLI